MGNALSSSNRMMSHISLRAFIGLLTLLLFTAVPAAVPLVPLDELKPEPEHRRATRLITHFVSNYHYRSLPLDDALSRRILARYLETLDPLRSYLLQSDVDEFNAQADRIDDYLRSATLAPLFDIFVRFRERIEERAAFAAGLLDQPFDFSLDESLDIDREDAPWAESRAALDELWRKRVKNDFLSLKLAGKDEDDIRKTLNERYTGLARRTAQLSSDDVFQTFMNAYATAVDPHTAYFSPRTSENFKIRMSLSLEGIGAVLQSENEMTLVREIVPGGPADLSGKLHAEDRIVGIAQDDDGGAVDVVGWRLDDVVDLIRGPKGSVVRLEVLPKGTPLGGPTHTVAITRDTIKLEEQAAKGSIRTVEGDTRLGVIDLPTFYMDFEGRSAGREDYRSTTRDVRKIIADLSEQGIDGLIVDLRGNGGGSLNEATELTGLFIDTGPVVQVRDSQGRLVVEKDSDSGVAYSGPLLVLVDRNSASASEIFAGAIQDYRRGLLVGEPTFGKGTVQNLVDLDRRDPSMKGKLGQLKMTIAQFFRVNGSSTQHRGVEPDIVLPTAPRDEDYGERSLENALPWASIEPAKYVRVAFADNELPGLRTAHEQRIAHDDSFQALLASEKAVDEAREKTTVSLQESVRRAEYQQSRRDQRARENAIRVAHGLERLPDEPDPGEGVTGDADDLNDDEAEETDKALEDVDVVLDEVGEIFRDWITGVQATSARLVGGPTDQTVDSSSMDAVTDAGGGQPERAP